MYSNQRDGYKLCALWRGLKEAVECDELYKAGNDSDPLERGLLDCNIIYDQMEEPAYQAQPAYDPDRRPPTVIHGTAGTEIDFCYDSPMVLSYSEDIDAEKDMGGCCCCCR